MSQDTRANLNTILLAVTIGLLGWIAFTTQETKVAIAELRGALSVAERSTSYLERELNDLRTRFNRFELDYRRNYDTSSRQ